MISLRKLGKWLAVAAASLLGLSAAALVVLWIWSERIIDRTYPVPLSRFDADVGAADLEEGQRLATLRGCYAGCHGRQLEGGLFNDDAMIGRIVTPDLTRAFAQMSDAALDALIRYGIKPDGTSTLLMPSASFHHLSDADLNDITAFIRSQPKSDGAVTAMSPGIMLRIMLVRGQWQTQAGNIAANAPWMPATTADTVERLGRYLALTVCAECHQMDLKGFPGFTPSLAATIAYSRQDFGRLLQEGIGLGDRELGLMRQVAIGRFVNFTTDEVDALYAYLRTLATQPD